MTSSRLSLVIDGCASSVFTGLLRSDGVWLSEVSLEGTPLEQLFESVQQTLSDAEVSLGEIDSYIYCEGPGSVLGLRLCAMAIETWSRLYPSSSTLYAYNSLSLTAAHLLQETEDLQRALIVSDWKKGAWNAVTINEGKASAVTVADQATVDQWPDALYHLPQRKGWQSPPERAVSLKYSPTALSKLMSVDGLLRETQSVELYSAGINTFQKWAPERHRAPAK